MSALLGRHHLDGAARREGVALHALVARRESAVLLHDALVYAGALRCSEEVGRHRADGEQVEERCDLGCARSRADALRDALAVVVEPCRGRMEVEVEALELEVSNLVRCDDLEPGEVLALGVAQVDCGGQEDALAVGRGELHGDPADVAVGDVGRFLQFDLGAGERVGVHAEESVHLLQLDAGRELVEQSLGAR